MRRLFERWYPWLGGLAIAAIYLITARLRTHVLPETVANLLSAIVSVGGIAVGFLLTAKSILIAIDDRPIIQRIKDAGFYSRIMTYLRSAISWSFALTIFSAVLLLFDYKNLQAWDGVHAAGTALWLFVATGAVLSYYRVARIWYAILDHLDTKHP